MPNEVKDIIELLCLIAKEKKMKAAIKQPEMGLVASGLMTLFGGVAGFVWSLFNGKESGQPVSEILMKLPPDEQQKLANKAKAIIKNLDWKDVRQLTALVKSKPDILQKLLAMLTTYITEELKAEIRYGD
ncbi:protein C19orf12 homolog [Arvicanthis niloticus]|uniref:protein C19orf12 homolog n=1 Tax=Arvicanthis niloticus TaxID=61156 RepID=UPI00402BA19A